MPRGEMRAASVCPRKCGLLGTARLTQSLAALLAAGVSEAKAWHLLAAQHAVAERVSRQLASGGQAAVALREEPHAGRALGAALELSCTAGISRSGILARIAAQLRALDDAERARQAAFAGPRATARLLALLPVAALGLGYLLGGSPLVFLFGSSLGLFCLLSGVSCYLAGTFWIFRLLLAAARPQPGNDPALTLELLAAVLDTGAAVPAALTIVGRVLQEDSLTKAGRSLRLGLSPETACQHLPAELASALALSLAAGANTGDLLRSAARDALSLRSREAEGAAARLGVRLVVPLGLLLLPAFVALGIVPTVASLITDVRW
ncbi:type II secretion system F family protein [Dermabacteraceae bacterium TAE3-ERU27]|nr:type II secretion system F family protein [Dermabacteraceae bacterium TAE3-ERU27]